MEAYREIIDAKLLLSIMQIPDAIQTQKFEVIAFPVYDYQQKTPVQKRQKAITGKYSFSTKNFKFNRDEANDYD